MSADLKTLLEAHLVRHQPPGREEFFSVKEQGLVELAAGRGQALAEVMVECLRAGLWPERFRPQRGTLTPDEQARLLESTAAVIGAGGLGGTVCLILARTGVGRLVVCDGDMFDESNLNRQMLSSLGRLGRNKALAAAEEIKNINPACRVMPYPVWAAPDNLDEILGPAQVVIDCLDTLEARYLVEEAAQRQGPCLLFTPPWPGWRARS